MQIDLDLTQQLQFLTFSQYPVEQNKIAEDYSVAPAIMFVRRNQVQDLFLGGQTGLNESEYDIEIYGTDIDAVDAAAELLRTPLNGFSGNMGLTFVYAAFVTDHSDDYTPKVELQTDEGLHVQTFALRLIHL